jgi:alpha-beta hydrolase superfamily lysophospholipase
MAFSIHTHRWIPESLVAPVQGIYLLHGVGEHAGRYERLAQRLTSMGFFVGAHDHPGHGKSDGKRGVIEPEHPLVPEALKQLEQFAKETGKPPILFGHSLGGVAAATIAIEYKLPLAGLILSAPALVPQIGRVDRFKLNALATVAPYYVQDLSYDPTRLTQDKQEQIKALNDPLIHGFKSASLINWIVKAGFAVTQSADKLHTPTLILVPEDDPVVHAEQTLAFADKLPDSQTTTIRYPDYKHEILNETRERRERVLADIQRWLIDLNVVD